MKPLLVIVSGPPGAGKTTVAKRLGAELGLPVFDRDDLKDAMFDTLGWSDREWSIKVGAASYEILYLIMERLLASGVSLVAETNFRRPRAAEQIAAIRARTGCRLVEVHCFAEPDVVARRFGDRWRSGGRHPGHVSEEYHLQHPDIGDRFVLGHPALGLDECVIEVDTTYPDGIDWDGVISAIRRVLEGRTDGPEDG